MTTDRHSSRRLGRQRILVGRERERAYLRELLDDAASQNGSLVLLSGEAGIGKTTLVQDLIQYAAGLGSIILTGGCYDLTNTPPYGPWSELFESYVPSDGLPATVPILLQSDDLEREAQNQAALFMTVRRFLESIATIGPLVLVLEDLHWSDQASLDLLRFVARHVDGRAILIVATYRQDELTRGHPFTHLLTLIARETGAVRLELQPLDTDAIRQIVSSYGLSEMEAARLTSYLEKRGSGNPFFTTELLRALESDGVLRAGQHGATLGELDESYLPPFVMQVIQHRLDRLDSRTRRALEIAAVIGQDIVPEVWEAVGGLEPATLAPVIEQAMDAHILEESADFQRLRFTHALLREVLYRNIVHTRRALHRRAAEALLARSMVDPNAVAYHFQQAEDERAPVWLIRAGLQARRSAAWFSAAECFRAAADLLDRDGSARSSTRGWLLFYTGFLLRFSGDPRTLEYLEEAERLAVLTGDTMLGAFVHYHRGASRCLRGDIRRGLVEIEAGVTALEELARTQPIRSTEDHVIAVISEPLHDAEIRVDNVTAAVPLPTGDSPGVVQQRGVLVNWLAHAGYYPRARQDGEMLKTAVIAALGEEAVRLGQSVSGLLGLGHAYAALGHDDEARRQYETARLGYTSVGDYAMVEYAVWVELLLVTLPYRTDQIAERHRLLADAQLAWDRAIGTTLGATHGTQCSMLVDLLEGRWTEARELAQQGKSAPNTHLVQGATINLGVLARHQGESSLAWEQVNALLPEGPNTEPGDRYFPHALAAQRLAVELALDEGDLDHARRWIDAHGRWLDWSGALLWKGDHHLLLTRYHQMAGELDVALRHAESALRHAIEPRQPLVLIAAHRMLGALHLSERRLDEAEQHLKESLDIAAVCGAPFESALTLLVQAELAIAKGKREEASELLQRASATCETLGARRALGQAARIESQLATQPAENPAGLTAREYEILLLVAAGQSNREIAEALFLSSRTVERHVANIYRKIDVRNRAEAATYVLRNDIS